MFNVLLAGTPVCPVSRSTPYILLTGSLKTLWLIYKMS